MTHLWHTNHLPTLIIAVVATRCSVVGDWYSARYAVSEYCQYWNRHCHWFRLQLADGALHRRIRSALSHRRHARDADHQGILGSK